MSRLSWICGCVALGMGLALGGDLCASTTDVVNDEFVSHAEKIKNFLFGHGMRYAGVAGGALGLIRCFATNSAKPLLVYGGIGLGVALVPMFIDGVFSVSGALLP